MRSSTPILMVCLAGSSCASGPGAIVTAPSGSHSTAANEVVAAPLSAEAVAPSACAKPWSLDVIGGDARVVVVCANDVRRQLLDESSGMARALSPALDPARERVCGCIVKVRPPAFVDLVFTAKPEEGKVTVQANGDEDLDPELGAAFLACVGTVSVAYAPQPSNACAGAGKVSFVYPVRLELGP